VAGLVVASCSSGRQAANPPTPATPKPPQTVAAVTPPPQQAGPPSPPASPSTGDGSTFTYRRTPAGNVTVTQGTIAPGAALSSRPGSSFAHVDRIRLSEGEMIITDAGSGGHFKAIKLHAGMTIRELERAARAEGATLTRVAPNSIKIFSTVLHFENGRLAEIENPMGDQ
jgi:hypothetical protein